jgi:hypothetical protein
MSDAPVIAAFDLATSTGVCWGRVGDRRPTLATWNTRQGGPTRPARLSWFFDLCVDFFDDTQTGYQIDQVWYEAPMALNVMIKIGASDETVAMLRGLVAVLELAAFRSGIKPEQIRSFDVQDARHHLTGKRRHGRTKSGRSLGKQEVMDIARMLGVEVTNDNEGDAFAGWSYACGLANPRIAHLVTPLFAS